MRCQEMVGHLVTHIGSGVTAEVDASLNILYDLVHAQTALMAPFTVFVKVSHKGHLGSKAMEYPRVVFEIDLGRRSVGVCYRLKKYIILKSFF